jgi:hypothetical protein
MTVKDRLLHAILYIEELKEENRRLEQVNARLRSELKLLVGSMEGSQDH